MDRLPMAPHQPHLHPELRRSPFHTVCINPTQPPVQPAHLRCRQCVTLHHSQHRLPHCLRIRRPQAPDRLHPRRIAPAHCRPNPAYRDVHPVRRGSTHHSCNHHFGCHSRRESAFRCFHEAPNSRCNSASRFSASRGVSPSTS